MSDSAGWETISSDENFANKNLAVVTDCVRSPARSKPCTWTVVLRKVAVIVAPMTRENKILLIRQERVPIRTAIWEVPAGQIDQQDANNDEIRETALRELKEETGYQLSPGGGLIELGHYFSSPGFTDEYGYFFLARPVEPSDEGPDRQGAESIVDCREFSISEIRRMIAENEIRDANTLGIFARLVARDLISFENG
ncbi:MAG TPA: NUDIX hydrolase [Chthoniobacterales bacterium]|nr:NUDIX hydrolase [Chthoniobacterales bacterium]